jgi:superfamily I DNA and/or RNA helicase
VLNDTGDHCQLPPTIKSAQAEKGGLGVTLFERIIKDTRFQQVVRLLDTQYRMNRRISDWASHNMYHDAIRSHPSVAEHTLRDILPRKDGSLPPRVLGGNTSSDNLSSKGNEESEPESDYSPVPPAATLPTDTEEAEDAFPVLLLVDSSGLGMYEDSSLDASKKAGASHRNFHEAELVRQHVLALVRAGESVTL